MPLFVRWTPPLLIAFFVPEIELVESPPQVPGYPPPGSIQIVAGISIDGGTAFPSRLPPPFDGKDLVPHGKEPLP